MSVRTNTSLTLLLLGALFGCSAETGDSASPTGQVEAPLAPAAGTSEAVAASATALKSIAKISVAGSTIELAQLGDDASQVLVSEQFDMSRGSVLQRLTEDGPLTSLEVFVSLKPEAAVPELLSERQAAEASALGRADASVRSVTFDANAPIQKWTATSCDGAIYHNEGVTPGKVKYSNKQRLDNVSGWKDLYVGTGPQSPIWTTSSVSLGVCNDATTALSVELWLLKPGQSWTGSPSVSIQGGQGYRWYMIYRGDLDTDCGFSPGDLCGGEPCICQPQRMEAAYMVRGNGSKFRSRTAEGKVVPPQIL
jgi:hypothetical protein